MVNHGATYGSVVCLTVIPMVAIFALFVTQNHADLENVNGDVRVEPRPSDKVRALWVLPHIWCS